LNQAVSRTASSQLRDWTASNRSAASFARECGFGTGSRSSALSKYKQGTTLGALRHNEHGGNSESLTQVLEFFLKVLLYVRGLLGSFNLNGWLD